MRLLHDFIAKTKGLRRRCHAASGSRADGAAGAAGTAEQRSDQGVTCLQALDAILVAEGHPLPHQQELLAAVERPAWEANRRPTGQKRPGTGGFSSAKRAASEQQWSASRSRQGGTPGWHARLGLAAVPAAAVLHALAQHARADL